MGSSPSSSAIVQSSSMTSNSKINSTFDERKGQQQQQQQIHPRSHFSKRRVDAPSQQEQSEELSCEERENKDNNNNNIEPFHYEKSIQSEMIFHDTEKDIKIHGGYNKNYNSNRIIPKNNIQNNTMRNHLNTNKGLDHNNTLTQSLAQKRGSFQSIEFQHQPVKSNTNNYINILNNGNTMTDNNNNHNCPGSPIGMGENRFSFRLTQDQQQQNNIVDHFDNKTHNNNNNNNINYKESSVAVSQHNGDIPKLQLPTNLFENEADQLFKSHGSSIDAEQRNSKKNTGIINSSTPEQTFQQQPLSEEILIQLLKHSRTPSNKNNLGVIQELGQSSDITSSNSPNGKQIFKSEIIQASKSKTNKDTFKKGNILLTVQEDTTNAIQQQLKKKSVQDNIIAELVDNNINITDFLLSEKEDIQNKIIVQKQKLKQSKLQAQQDGDQAKMKKNKRNHYGEGQTYDGSISSFSQLGSTTQTQSSLTSFGSTTNASVPSAQTQGESNIMISYCQDWEIMRKTGFKTQTISTIS